MLPAAAGVFEGQAQDALHLRTAVDAGVIGRVSTVLPALLAEVHAPGEFPDAQEIGPVHELGLEGGLVHEGLEGLHGTEVRIQAQPLPDSQEALLRTDFRRRVVIVLGVAHGAEKHGVALHAQFVRFLRIGVPEPVDGAGAHVPVRVGHLMAETGAHGVHRLDGLFHDLRADAVAGQFCNLEFHIRLFSIKFSIFTVALMAASAWSESTPRVLKAVPSRSHEIVVSTRASVFPPGGIFTT